MLKSKTAFATRSHGESFSCSECYKLFKTKGGLNIHVKSHRPDTYLLQCPECQFTSFQKSNFAKHLAVIHKRDLSGKLMEESFMCSQCDFKCTTEYQLKNHNTRKHTSLSKKEFKCRHCVYATVEKASLLKHVRIRHTLERPFVCQICSSSFNTASAIARHGRSHTQAKPYKCSSQTCSKEYADLKRLKEHVMTHSNEKPFSCSFCKYSTNRNDNLKTHIRRNHTDYSQSTTQIFPQDLQNSGTIRDTIGAYYPH